MPETSESERYLAAMGRWGTWGDDLFAMSHLLRRPIYIVTDRENDDEALIRTPYHDFEGNVGRTHIHYLPWVQALRSVSALVKDLAPSGWTFEQEWKHVVGNMGDLARTGCHCVLLESWNLSKQNSDAQVKQLQFSPRTWPGTRWPVCTLQFRPPFPETEPGQLTLLEPSALQYPDASIRTYVNLYIINKWTFQNIMSDLHIAKVHPFNFVCFSQQKTQNQQKSIKILPKSEQNHGYLRYLLYMIGHQMLPYPPVIFPDNFINHL